MHIPSSLKAWWQRLSQRLSAPAQPLPPEDSVWLRFGVQILVCVGILATDTAASTLHSIWAIPLSLGGTLWSWRQRRRRNIPAKIVIAVGMIAVLAAFLTRLVGQSGDSRILLAELLIQVQILHSFDLPRRKDLGYSAVIGVILVGVAATVSETLIFGGWLLLFVAIALPVLMLDYRSRLGLIRLNRQSISIGPAQLVKILLGVVTLGLVIFALLPRLPGYQLRTLPVSAAIDFQGKFDAQKIVNPGYGQSNGKTWEENGLEGEDLTGQIAFDDQFYYGFNQTINQNLRGILKPQLVMRVRSQAPGFWRVLAFDQYTGQGWQLSGKQKAETLYRPAWSYRFAIPQDPQRGRTKEVIQTYSIVAPFPNLIPALSQAREVYFPTREIARDPEGGLRSPVQLQEGLTYSVISDVPYRDRTVLREASHRYPPFIRQQYLQIPADIAPHVRRQTQALLAKANHPPQSAYEKALYLAQTLKQTYFLQPDLPILSPKEDLVNAFLFKYKGGYPDHFSTVLTIMLRSIDIPARLVTGLGPGRFNAFTGMYEVQNIDAYALSEVYIPHWGWFTFDPIPGHDLVPPSVEDDYTFSVFKSFWSWVAGWLPSPLVNGFTAIFTALGTGLAQALGFLTSGWQGWILGVLVLSGLAILVWLSPQIWRFWRYRQRLASLPPMERLYQQMLTILADGGTPKYPHEAPFEYVQRIDPIYSPIVVTLVLEISQAYVGWRYGQQKGNVSRIHEQLQVLRKQVSSPPIPR
jgi:transglutaminase-like putative cysteine protease